MTCCLVLTIAKPQQCIEEEGILIFASKRGGQLFIRFVFIIHIVVTHVCVDHLVFCVCPNDRIVAATPNLLLLWTST